MKKAAIRQRGKRGIRDIYNAKDAIQTILATRLVVGFHPDQATDPAIDLAKELNVNYCIVPCCVFPREFPNRLIKPKYDEGDAFDPRVVRSYNELIQFLQEKYTPHTAKLGFHFAESAKNLCLYTNNR